MEIGIAAFVVAGVNGLVFLAAGSLALYRTRRQGRPTTSRARITASMGDRRDR